MNEAGSVERREIVDHIVTSARHSLRNASSVAGVRQAVAFPAGAIIKSREGTRFLLETLFERDSKRVEPIDAVGTLLDGSFLEPLPDEELDALLRELDAR